jgi:Protein of unknown function (DUF1501).
MQEHAPEAVDLASETDETTRSLRVHANIHPVSCCGGVGDRRLVERGVRFVQLYSRAPLNDDNWDAHGDLVKHHDPHAGNTDSPSLSLL